MRILTEFSGFGHYGVFSIIDRSDLQFVSQEIAKSADNPIFDGWLNNDLDRWHPFGYAGSLRFLTRDVQEQDVKLVWHPDYLSDAMRSVNLLIRMLPLDSRGLPENGLEVYPNKRLQGWDLKANLGGKIWNVIESEAFDQLLPQINHDIQLWWEDQWNKSFKHEQLGTRFRGKDGITMQVYQPTGDGLWIAGSRKTDYSYQIGDHNTDCWTQCFGHVISLCTILKYCRQQLGPAEMPS